MVTNRDDRYLRGNAPGGTGGQEVPGSNPGSPTRRSQVTGAEGDTDISGLAPLPAVLRALAQS